MACAKTRFRLFPSLPVRAPHITLTWQMTPASVSPIQGTWCSGSQMLRCVFSWTCCGMQHLCIFLPFSWGTVWLHFQDGEDYRVARRGPRHLESGICLHLRNPFQNVRLKSGRRCRCLPCGSCGSPRLGILVKVPEALKVKDRTSLPSMDPPCMWQPWLDPHLLL